MIHAAEPAVFWDVIRRPGEAAMATKSSAPNQITTTQVDPTVASPSPVVVVAPPPTAVQAPAAPVPTAPQTEGQPGKATGVDGEFTIWEASYSMKNFLGRLIAMGILTVVAAGLAVYSWSIADPARAGGMKALTIVAGIVLGVLWLLLIRRIILARFGHYYKLTNRRLFVSTGIFNRRRDQMELLKVQDVYTRQTFFGRMLSIGTVIVTSSENNFPFMYLTGVEDPKAIMDLVWHHARSEREGTAVQVDSV